MKQQGTSVQGNGYGTNSGQARRSELSPVWAQQEPFSLIRSGRRFFSGIRKLYVAVRYKLFYYRNGIVLFFQRTWVRIGILALAVFLVFGKDLRFSAELPALWGGDAPLTEGRTAMGLVQPTAYSDEPVVYDPASASELEDGHAMEYIDRFDEVARLEMQRFGIPASILMAQALSESRAGQHEAVRRNNNHFGSALSGRHFANAWESWRANSLLMAQGYPELLTLGKDPERWAKGLRKAGYSREWGYSRRLLRIVQKYQLQRLDH
jgi:hypothetical protein